MSALKILAAVIAVVMLGACALPERPAQRAAAFDLVGRVAVTFDGRNFSSGLRWEHAAERDEVWLNTPTGQAVAHILADDEGATLTGADRQTYRAADVESLTRRALGWELPLARLAWWVRGETVPGGAAAADPVRDQQGRLVRFSQDGWNITLTHAAEGRGLPQRLELARAGHHIRLVVDSWRGETGTP